MKNLIKWTLIFICVVSPYFQIGSNGLPYHFYQGILCSALVALFFMKYSVVKVNKFRIKASQQLAIALCYPIPLTCNFFDPPRGINKPMGFVLLIISFVMAVLVFGTEWEVKKEQEG